MEKLKFQNYFIGGKQYKVNGDQLLGEGATAKVYKATQLNVGIEEEKQDGKEVALKIYDIKNSDEYQVELETMK